MRQLLLLIFLFFASQWLFRKLRRARAHVRKPARNRARCKRRARRAALTAAAATCAGDAPQLTDPLVRCAECGVHTPSSESLVVAGQRFCCSDHAHRHAARPTGRDAR